MQPLPSWRATDEPAQPPNPQIGDIQRLFQHRFLENFPSLYTGHALNSLIMGGHLGGGNNI